MAITCQEKLRKKTYTNSVNWAVFLFPLTQNIHVCLGSLFVPEAYITATRQYVAQANSWSLEELCLEVNVTNAQGTPLDACSFGIKGKIRNTLDSDDYASRSTI